jgi:hypothetical protein
MSGSGIQPWSLPGSKIRALKRPWTGVCQRPDSSTFLIYEDCTSRNDATPALKKLAIKEGGELLAAINGWHEKRILDMKWGPGDGKIK